jgi:hypothetical protein
MEVSGKEPGTSEKDSVLDLKYEIESSAIVFYSSKRNRSHLPKPILRVGGG